jgi:hypothetical protein
MVANSVQSYANPNPYLIGLNVSQEKKPINNDRKQ